MAALMRIIEYGTAHSSREMLQKFLDEAEALTESRIGFFHFVEKDQKTISLQTWSTNTMKVCEAPGAGTHYPVEQAGVWVDCIRSGGPVIHNDYATLPGRKGLPEGHVALVRELVVPVFQGGALKAILGVGNKTADYDEDDLAVVEQLAKLAWETIDRKRAEEENRRLRMQFFQSQKMESIGRLAGGVAHDFNNMLSVILGHVDIALAKTGAVQPLHEELKGIQEAARRSADLTRQLLAFSSQQPIDPISLNLNPVVGNMLKLLGRMIGENIELIWKPGEDLGDVKIDPAQVDQILVNLCVNARDAIAGAGRIVIETGNVVFDDTYCEERFGLSPGRYVMLSVSDDGCGMDRETLNHIYEPFFTTKAAGEGTGLGLSTVYGIVRQYDGYISVYSEPGRGTSFNICFQRHDEGEPGIRIESAGGITEGKGETILLVEDEKLILNFARRLLATIGYRVLTADTPARALQIMEEDPGGIDLLITDMVMPGMNGHELVDRITKIRPDIKTLYMSGYRSDLAARRGGTMDNVHFLQKPFSKRDLAAKVREAMAAERVD